jgi:hypothetical protein
MIAAIMLTAIASSIAIAAALVALDDWAGRVIDRQVRAADRERA